jgi:tetratricopeptide (TPR) repeat protein
MKSLILLLNFVCFALGVTAQRNVAIYTALKFNHGYQEKKWVVLKKADTASSYTFGYVYIDTLKGLIFQKAGTFKINKKNKYIPNNANLNQTFSKVELYPLVGWQTRINYSWLPVALLPAQHFKELKIEAEPAWVKPYYVFTDTLAHNYQWACIYGYAQYTFNAIEYLQKVYKVDPHYIGKEQKIEFGYYLGCQGVELKLAWAYNSLDQPDKAITILNAAIQHDPKNIFLFYVLGNSYERKENWEMALNAYKQGLQLMGIEKSELKGNLAYGISNNYDKLNKLEEAKNWRAIGDKYNPHPGRIY